MKPLLSFCALALLAACAVAPLRIPVQPVTIPAQTTVGLVCFVEVSDDIERLPVTFRSVTYEATATYRTESATGGVKHVQVYGRSTPPEFFGTPLPDVPCVPQADEDNIVLSGRYALTPNEPQRIQAGEGPRGEALAQLVKEPRFWLGLSLEGGAAVGIGELITLTEGVIIASF